MKIKWTQLCRWMLGIMGISASIYACKKEEVTRAEYGCPYIEYSVKGKVVDSRTGAGVAGIEVSQGLWGSDADTTGTDGLFAISGAAGSNHCFEVSLRDIDPDKDGRYKTDTVSVELTKVGDGDGHWYGGEYEARDVILKVEEQENGQK